MCSSRYYKHFCLFKLEIRTLIRFSSVSEWNLNQAKHWLVKNVFKNVNTRPVAEDVINVIFNQILVNIYAVYVQYLAIY